MKVLDGQLPEGIEWRVLVALEPGQDPDIALEIGNELARTNRGDLVIATFVPNGSSTALAPAMSLAAELRQRPLNGNRIHRFVLVIEEHTREATLIELVKKASIDLVMVIATGPDRYDYRDVPCAVAMLRLVDHNGSHGEAKSKTALKRVLVPTSGGPNSAYALSLMMLLGPETETTALYVAQAGRGENEEALGQERLRQVLDFVHAGAGVYGRLIVHEDVAAGIVEEASRDYDLVVIGASEESRLDQVIFGNIPAAVIQQCEKPVMVMRQNRGRLGNAVTAMDWWLHTIFPRKSIGERAEIYARIRRGARPETPSSSSSHSRP